QVVAATLTRLVLNSAHRMVYAFLPAFSRALGLPLESLTGLLSLRGAMGLAAPAFGALPGRVGQRHTLVIALLVFVVGAALPAVWPSPAAFVLFVVLVALSKYLFDPALQAYLADRTPYARRGLVIAFSEMSWSGAALVGLPLAGLLIAWFDW